MKYIETGQTRSDAKRKWKVMVDDEDFEYLQSFNWQVDKYSSVNTHGNYGMGRTLMCRLIMKPPLGVEIDHIDGNRLNNQKSNLRFANSSQNKCNRGARKDSKSGIKGVSWHSQRNKWTVRIKIPYGKYLSLGLYDDKDVAAKVYNQAARKYHGEFAFVNKKILTALMGCCGRVSTIVHILSHKPISNKTKMAKVEKIEEEVKTTAKSAREVRWAEFLDRYKAKNPVKYASKKENKEFDNIPASFK